LKPYSHLLGGLEHWNMAFMTFPSYWGYVIIPSQSHHTYFSEG
jgi:hypothetical protein